jgi:hypothetical protein
MSIQSIARNSFQHTLAVFSGASDAGEADLFSRAAVEIYERKTWDEWGYRFTQIFEPGVLQEVAMLEGIPYDDLRRLKHRPSPALTWLGTRADAPAELSFVEKINVASALVSISRFDAAESIIATAASDMVSDRDRFELGWIEFLISNRCDDGARSPRAFRRMRAAMDEGAIPPSRVLDMCVQGVVWYVKRREVSDDDYAWCLRTGAAIAAESGVVDPGAISSWYRGVAMVPAATADAALTRDYMRRAEETALESYALRTGAFELNALKTYHESAIKEHMYVTKDVDRALKAAKDLVALDPNWSPSYGEMADAYCWFGRPEEAAEFYERAARMGPPYVAHHLLQAARCWVKVQAPDQALIHYQTLSAMAPDHAVVRAEGGHVAKRASEASRRRYLEAIEARRAS